MRSPEQQVDDPLGALQQHVQALVGGQATCEADGQHVGVEVRRLDVLARLVATEAVDHAALARPAHQRGALLAARGPQLGVVDVVEPVPRGLVRGAVHPALAEVAIEQRAHRIAQPGGEVDAVGDVADGHLVDRAIGPQRGPHLARDLAVAAADAVARAARVQGELRHAEGLAVVVGARAPEPDDGVEVDADLAGQRAQRLDDQLGLVGVVARGHRGVRGEHGARAGRVQRVLAATRRPPARRGPAPARRRRRGPR